MNPFKSAVGWAYKKPNLLIAVIFALLPAILSFLLFIVYNIPVDYLSQGYLFLRALIILALSATILYILLYIFKGKALQGKFFAVMTAFSFTYLIRLIAAIFFVISLFFIMPGLFPALSGMAAADLTVEQFMDYIESIPIQENLIVLLGAIIFVILLGIAIIIAIPYLIYLIIAKAAPSSRLTNIIILLIMLIFLSLIEAIVP